MPETFPQLAQGQQSRRSPLYWLYRPHRQTSRSRPDAQDHRWESSEGHLLGGMAAITLLPVASLILIFNLRQSDHHALKMRRELRQF